MGGRRGWTVIKAPFNRLGLASSPPILIETDTNRPSDGAGRRGNEWTPKTKDEARRPGRSGRARSQPQPDVSGPESVRSRGRADVGPLRRLSRPGRGSSVRGRRPGRGLGKPFRHARAAGPGRVIPAWGWSERGPGSTSTPGRGDASERR